MRLAGPGVKLLLCLYVMEASLLPVYSQNYYSYDYEYSGVSTKEKANIASEEIPDFEDMDVDVLNPEEDVPNPEEVVPTEEADLIDTSEAAANLTIDHEDYSEEAGQYNMSETTNLTMDYEYEENMIFYLDNQTMLSLNMTANNSTKTLEEPTSGIHFLQQQMPTYMVIILYLASKILTIFVVWMVVKYKWRFCRNNRKAKVDFNLEEPQPNLYRSQTVDDFGHLYCDLGGELPRTIQPVCAACLEPSNTTVEEVRVSDSEMSININIKKKTKYDTDRIKEVGKDDHVYEELKVPNKDQKTPTADQEAPTTVQATADIHHAVPCIAKDQMATAEDIDVVEEEAPSTSTTSL